MKLPAAVLLVGALLGAGCKSGDGGSPADSAVDGAFPPNQLGLEVLASRFMAGVVAHASVVQDGKLFVASGGGGLTIFNIAAGGVLTPSGSLPLDGLCTGVAVQGTTALLACGSAGAHAVDVSDPTNPKLARTVAYGQQVQRDAMDVKILGDVGFVLDRKLGIYLLRPVSQPDKISPYAQTDTATLNLERASGLQVDPSAIYVSDTTKGVHILSYTIPESPHLEQVVPLSGGARSVFVSQGKAYCATHQLGLGVLKLGDKPPQTYFLEDPEEAWYAAVEGGRAYIADYGPSGPRLMVANVEDPAKMKVSAVLALTGEPRHVTLHQSYAFVSAAGGGLHVVDISNPDQPKVVTQQTGAGEARAVALHGTLALVAAGKGGLYLLDTAAPRAPAVQSVYLPSHADVEDVVVSDGLAFVMTGISGLHILDLADPRSPRLVGTYIDGPKRDMALAVKDKTAYLCSSFSNGPGLDIVDVSNPKAPARKGVLWNEVMGSSIAVGLGHAYVGRSKLYVVDLADPTAPKVVKTFSDQATALHLSAKTLFLAGGTSEQLTAYDLQDPAAPKPFKSFDQNRLQSVTGIFVDQQRLYVTGSGGSEGLPGLQVLDLDRLWAMMPKALLSSVPTPGDRLGVLHDAARQLTFVADGKAGLTIIGTP